MKDASRFESSPPFHNETARQYFEHSSAPRINTDIVLVEALRREYPQLHLTVVPRGTCNILAYASAGHASLGAIDQEKDRLRWRQYLSPAKRLDGAQGHLAEHVYFGKFLLDWQGREFVFYVANGRDGNQSYPEVENQYILSASVDLTNKLLLEAGTWTNALHDEIWVFDQSAWQKSRELWQSVQSAEWANVILDEDMKKGLIRDVDTFFNSRETYKSLKVPWKRGALFYGPPGNGKTISIKAIIHTLLRRKDPIPALYVRTLTSWMGPEGSLAQIFAQARRYAPCYLIFEDLDTIITSNVRSYFFNEVDGLKNNDGIFMVGSTNHIDDLDDGIKKRPSRFDRKYLFPDPNEVQRAQYAKFWQGKLKDNKAVEFPDELCEAVAQITDGFSFAYMQEAFVAALLAIAGTDDNESQEAVPTGVSLVKLRYRNVPASRQLYIVRNAARTIGPYGFGIGATPRRTVSWNELLQRGPAKDGPPHWKEYGEDVCMPMEQDAAQRFGANYGRDNLSLLVDDPSLDKLVLWRELKRQVKILRDEMGDEV